MAKKARKLNRSKPAGAPVGATLVATIIAAVAVCVMLIGDDLMTSTSTSTETSDGARELLAPSTLHVNVHENGARRGAGTAVVWDAPAFDAAYRTHVLHTSDGQHLTDFRALARRGNGTHVYRVPRVLNEWNQPVHHFVYPEMTRGETIRLEGSGLSDPPPRGPDKPMLLEAISNAPRVYFVHNFMSDHEVKTMIAASMSPDNPYSLRPSTTGHQAWTEGDGAAAQTNPTRTSENGFDLSSSAATAVMRRAFKLLRIERYDQSMIDGVQVLRYEQKQAYIAHTDWFEKYTSDDHNWDPQAKGSNRFATVFLYLSDVEEGGQTVFPLADRPKDRGNSSEALAQTTKVPETAGKLFSKGSWEHKLVQQCYSKLAITPKKGSAILFYSQLPDGTLDPLSLHGACPVLQGTKWAGNLWVWNACRRTMCDARWTQD